MSSHPIPMFSSKFSEPISFLFFALISGGAYGESLLRDSSLHADRFSDAPVIARLSAGVPLQVVKSEAGWIQVKSGEYLGWIRASEMDSAGAKAAETAQMQNGRLAGNNILSASGIRSPQKIESAQPNGEDEQ